MYLNFHFEKIWRSECQVEVISCLFDVLVMRTNTAWTIIFAHTTAIFLFLWLRSDNYEHNYEDRFSASSSSRRRNNRRDRLERMSNYDEVTMARLEELISKKADANDPDVIQLVKELMDPPATSHPLKLSRFMFKTPQAHVVDKYLGRKLRGFFLEVGAYEGERSSNTLFFEIARAWKGLLVEADPFFYTQLLGKNRRAWSINACLSPTSYVSKLQLQESDTGKGRMIMERSKKNELHLVASRNLSLFSGFMTIPCFPLESMLAALGVKRLDFFSLDVEGMEMDILKSLDLKKLDIRTLAVEYAHGNKSAYLPFMEQNGYILVKEIRVADRANFLYAKDFIFAKLEK